MDTCFWASGNYWSTRDPKLKKNRASTGIKIAYLNKTGWFAFVFSKYNPKAVEVFRSVPKGEVWFYQEPINQFKSFSAWCIDAKHFESVLSQMRSLSNIDIEFVVPTTRTREKPTQNDRAGNVDLATMERRDRGRGAAVNQDLATPTQKPQYTAAPLPQSYLSPTSNPNTRKSRSYRVRCRSSLCIPAPFRDMGLEFFEVGSVGRRPSKIRQPSTKDLSTPTGNPNTRLPDFTGFDEAP